MSQQNQEFKEGELVMCTIENSIVDGKLCRITKICSDGSIWFDIVSNGYWNRNYNVRTFKVFRKLTKLEKALR